VKLFLQSLAALRMGAFAPGVSANKVKLPTKAEIESLIRSERAKEQEAGNARRRDAWETSCHQGYQAKMSRVYTQGTRGRHTKQGIPTWWLKEHGHA
jgi:hypothetical protein